MRSALSISSHYEVVMSSAARLFIDGVVTHINKLETALRSISAPTVTQSTPATFVADEGTWAVTSLKTDTVIETPAELLVDTVRLLRGWLVRSCSLVDIAVLDFPAQLNRFSASYVFGAIATGERFILRTATSAFQPLVSIVGYFPNANWVEREVSEMYGLIVLGHPNGSKLLCDYRGGDANQRKGSGANTCEEYSRDELTAELMSFAIGGVFLSLGVSL